jgi:hypothetical protein
MSLLHVARPKDTHARNICCTSCCTFFRATNNATTKGQQPSRARRRDNNTPPVSFVACVHIPIATRNAQQTRSAASKIWTNRSESKSAKKSRHKAKTLTLTNRKVYATNEVKRLPIKQALIVKQDLASMDFMDIQPDLK